MAGDHVLVSAWRIEEKVFFLQAVEKIEVWKWKASAWKKRANASPETYCGGLILSKSCVSIQQWMFLSLQNWVQIVFLEL